MAKVIEVSDRVSLSRKPLMHAGIVNTATMAAGVKRVEWRDQWLAAIKPAHPAPSSPPALHAAWKEDMSGDCQSLSTLLARAFMTTASDPLDMPRKRSSSASQAHRSAARIFDGINNFCRFA